MPEFANIVPQISPSILQQISIFNNGDNLKYRPIRNENKSNVHKIRSYLNSFLNLLDFSNLCNLKCYAGRIFSFLSKKKSEKIERKIGESQLGAF
jgi:hypothetical protein